jgi:hypothetical protein
VLDTRRYTAFSRKTKCIFFSEGSEGRRSVIPLRIKRLETTLAAKEVFVLSSVQ